MIDKELKAIAIIKNIAIMPAINRLVLGFILLIYLTLSFKNPYRVNYNRNI